ncbi:Uncharacterised protein [Serratia marcescens]|nr:Uncharacterised protein [Serratia marcescens]
MTMKQMFSRTQPKRVDEFFLKKNDNEKKTQKNFFSSLLEKKHM